MKLFRIKESLEDLHKHAEDWNGYEREKAVKRLGNIASSSSIPVLLRRVNDWVPQVRQAAKESLLALCTTQNAEAFVHQLPNVFHLQNCGRADHSVLMDGVVEYLLKPDNQNIIVNNICNSDRKIARICLMLSIENKLESPEKVIQLGFKHQDVIVRSMAFELFKPALEGITKPLVKMAQYDSFMPIRREVLRMSWEASRNVEMAKVSLFDKHASVRSLSVRLLEDGGFRGETEALYIDEINSNSCIHKVRCAIWGIGHLKLVKFEGNARHHLGSPYSSIRKQALMSLIKLDIDDVGEVLRKSLFDESPSIRKLSELLHKTLELSYSVDELLLLAQNANNEELRKSCFDLSRLSSRWDRLIFFITLLNDKYVDLFDRSFVIDSVRVWGADSNRVAASPSPTQTLRLKELVEGNPDILTLDKTMPFLLRTFGVIETSS